MWSNSFSVGYRKVFLYKKLLQVELGGSTGIDVYEKGMLQNYIVEKNWYYKSWLLYRILLQIFHFSEIE